MAQDIPVETEAFEEQSRELDEFLRECIDESAEEHFAFLRAVASRQRHLMQVPDEDDAMDDFNPGFEGDFCRRVLKNWTSVSKLLVAIGYNPKECDDWHLIGLPAAAPGIPLPTEDFLIKRCRFSVPFIP